MASKCAAITREGRPCRGVAATGSDWCPAHDPSRSEARKRAAAKAGKSRGPGGEITEIKTRLSDLADDVLAQRVDKGVGAVASQVLNVYLRAVEVERKIRETEELEERLEELEQARERGGRQWG